MYILIIIVIFSLVYYKYNNLFTEITTTKIYSMGTGLDKSPYHNFGQLVQNNVSYEMEVKISEGSIENILKIENNELDFALCQEEIAFDAVSKLGAFANKEFKNINFVCGIYFEFMHFIVKNKKQVSIQINTVDDLRKSNNYKIGIGPKNSGSYNNFFLISKLFNLVPISLEEKSAKNTVYYVTGTYNELFNQFVNDELDGLFIVSSPNNIYIKNLVKNDDVTFLDISDNVLLTDLFSQYFYKKQIDLSNYYTEIIKQDTIGTLASRAILICNKNVEQPIVAETIRNVFLLQNIINPYDDYTPIEMAFCRNAFTLHNGAKQYLKSIGLVSGDTQYSYDLNFYAENVVKNYWTHDKIGNKLFSI